MLKTTFDFGKRAAAVVLIGLVLLLTLASASPSLHQAIHSDAGSPDHQCVVKLFNQGQVDAAAATPIMAAPVQLFAGVDLPAETFSLPSADYRFSSSRAPPCAELLPS